MQLMADVRLPDGTLRSVLVKSATAAPGQRGYIARDGMLVVYGPAYYNYYGWYGWYGGGWAAIFLIWLFCSLVLMCMCLAQEPAEVRYVKVHSDDSCSRHQTPKEKDEAKAAGDSAVPLQNRS